MHSFVWPNRTWPLAALTETQWRSWQDEGYLVVPDAVPLRLARAAAAAVREYVGADDTNRSSWYTNVLDIYEDTLPDGKRPHHGPCGMVQMFHHSSLWALRQHPRVHEIFADLYGTRRLFVTVDRAHFKPPVTTEHPAWSDAGEVHSGLHWDVNTRRENWPLPYSIQGVLYLEDTAAAQGALRLVPGFHSRLAAWDAAQPADRSSERPEGEAAAALDAEALSVGAAAASLVVWHSALPHGPAPNTQSAPRVSAYLSMLPVDAAPFLGAQRAADAPLSMADAGTLAYHEEQRQLVYGLGGESAAAGTPPRLRRQSAARRAERWRLRLPMLDEDPREEELPVRPPGEGGAGAVAAALTPLGERLVGLVEWEEEEPAEVCARSG